MQKVVGSSVKLTTIVRHIQSFCLKIMPGWGNTVLTCCAVSVYLSQTGAAWSSTLSPERQKPYLHGSLWLGITALVLQQMISTRSFLSFAAEPKSWPGFSRKGQKASCFVGRAFPSLPSPTLIWSNWHATWFLVVLMKKACLRSLGVWPAQGGSLCSTVLQ